MSRFRDAGAAAVPAAAETDPLVAGPEPPTTASSSMALANVYCTLAVNPLCSRRRNWICPASRVELPFEPTYKYPAGHSEQGLIAPAGYVCGRNSWVPCVPLM